MIFKILLVIVVVVVVVVLYGRLVGRRDAEKSYPGLQETVRARISREISGGRKVNAIKIYREATGAALTDARRVIDTWFVPGRGPGVEDAARSWTEGRLTPEARARISRLIEDGRREDAMALYAAATGASDTEAHAIIRTWDTSQDY
jgi:endonuclease V-like protein UPF0215 family